MRFSREVGFRTLGENTHEIVNNYVRKQVGKSDYVDKRFKKFLSGFTVLENDTDLSVPLVIAHGRYWYNIHLVVVVSNRRCPVSREENFERIKSCIMKIALKKNCWIAGFAVLPDHVHISLKGNPEISPAEIGLSFMNNLAYVLGHKCWSEEFYVGSFSEYSLDKLR